MIKNVTVLLLQLASLSSNSALFSPATFSQPSYYNFHRISLTKHYSTFLNLYSSRASSVISNSKFSYFLNSVIHIHQDVIPQYDGISEQDNNPISPRVSFVCNHTVFEKNTSPFNGAAILVHSNINSINSINAAIEDTSFNNNVALLGGAIYYESSSINLTKCHFKANDANYGSHVFLSCTTSNVNLCTFQESPQSSSTIELTSSETSGTYSFNNDQFFLNKGPFRVNGVPATLSKCCFLNYNGIEYDKFDNNDIFDPANKGTIALQDVIVNDKKCSGLVTNSGVFTPPDKYENISDSSCRLIPSPTATSHYTIKDEPAIFALVAIIFFVLVSIIGIFIVTCKKKKDIPPDDAVNEPLTAKK